MPLYKGITGILSRDLFATFALYMSDKERQNEC